MLKKILIGVAVVVLGFVALVATRPSTFHVERSASVAAGPEVVYPLVADFRRWEGWSPWEKLDPAMKKTYEGTPATVGAGYTWKGQEVGAGRMTITEVKEGERLAIKLDFLEPFESTNRTTFTFAKEPSGTRVTWAMDGDANFLTKAMTLFKSMDAMVGPDFQQGLSTLKGLAEAEAKTQEQAKQAERAAEAPAAPEAPTPATH